MSDLFSDPGVISSYGSRKGPAPERLLIPAGVGALVTYFMSQYVTTTSPLGPVLFAVLFLVVAGSGCYREASKAWRLELTAGSLRWRSIFGSGDIPLTELTSIRLQQQPRNSLASPIAVIRSTGRRPVRISARDGLPAFAAELKRAAPQVEVRLPASVS